MFVSASAPVSNCGSCLPSVQSKKPVTDPQVLCAPAEGSDNLCSRLACWSIRAGPPSNAPPLGNSDDPYGHIAGPSTSVSIRNYFFTGTLWSNFHWFPGAHSFPSKPSYWSPYPYYIRLFGSRSRFIQSIRRFKPSWENYWKRKPSGTLRSAGYRFGTERDFTLIRPISEIRFFA